VRHLPWVATLVATLLSLWLSATRLRLSTDMTALFPARAELAALARYARAFGGGDVAIVLVRGDDPAAVAAAADDLESTLAKGRGAGEVMGHVRAPRAADPTLAWRWAGPRAEEKLARALTPEGMRERLRDTKALLLAPGSGDASEWLARDPLRLMSIPWEDGAELAAGARTDAGGKFVADGGKARMVLLRARGRALESKEAAAFVTEMSATLGALRARHAGVELALTGGHAIAFETEQMMRHDLGLSAMLSTVLASLMFVLTFRRARALIAILPPLGLGTLWTMGLCAVFAPDLSAVATAFAAIVVGVGVDTGVHVYAALMEGRRRGLSPGDAAMDARRATYKPTMAAAIVAGMAFGSLALSDLPAMRQLGALCALGEVLTSVAILGITPQIGAWLERGEVPARNDGLSCLLRAPHATRRRARLTLAVAALPLVAIALFGWPETRGAITAIRPTDLTTARTWDEISRLFGGRPGQWVVLSVDRDAERARARGDAIADALEPLARARVIDGFDTLSSWAPAPVTQRARLARRDALRLPERRAAFEQALRDEGFDTEACAPALRAFESPSIEISDMLKSDDATVAWLASRHIAVEGGETIVATYVRPLGEPDADDRARRAIVSADAEVVITGYGALERSLRESLARELPKIGLVAVVLVALALRAILRRGRDVAVAIGVLVVEIAIVVAAMRALGVGWHIYDALVLPVLVGITVDEVMFLLFEVRVTGEDDLDTALAHQAPLVASTALTTAAGFAALLVCRFGGLRDLGAVGAIGSAAGLICAILLVPAALRAQAKAGEAEKMR
jgi:hypothetical protein